MVMKEAFIAASKDQRNRGVRKWLGFAGAKAALFIGGVKDTNPKIETPQPLQMDELFAKELGFKTKEEYITTLPKFEPQPDNWKGRFDIPAIVETRIPVKRMLELAGIGVYFDPDSIKDWENGKFKTPDKPYTVWLNDGSSNLNKSVDQVRKSLKADERGANIYEVIALYLRDPKILNHHYLDVPGSQVGSDRAPYLDRWFGQPWLGHRFVGFEYPFYGSVVAGREIRT